MIPQWAEQTGIILFTQNYDACVAFYRDVIGLRVHFEKDTLTCFVFGGAYLMVETGGVAIEGEKTFAQNAVTLRLNVRDVDAEAVRPARSGVSVEVFHRQWGTTALMHDPDGNRVELKNHFDGFFAPAQ